VQLHEQTAQSTHPAEAELSPEGAAEVKIGQAPIGAAAVKTGQALSGPGEVKIGQAPIGSEAPRGRPKQAALCEPYRPLIEAKLAAGLSAQRIFQDLVREQGFAGKYHSVRRFVRRLSSDRPLPFRRMECAPGDEVQVDFGTGAPIVQPDGRRRRTHVFRMVLSHSRKGYSEAVYRQTTDDFIRCLENAFGHFGGLPKSIVLDNPKAGVDTPDWYDPELNPKLRSFADHYGLAILPTRPRTPRHKDYASSCTSFVTS